jgi:hypothetical protein
VLLQVTVDGANGSIVVVGTEKNEIFLRVAVNLDFRILIRSFALIYSGI